MRYPIISIDYARSKILLATAEDLLARSKRAIEDLKTLQKECSKLDRASEEFDADYDDFLEGAHEIIGLAIADEFELQLEPLETAIERYAEAVNQLRPVAEQAEAWDKYFRKQWQTLFRDAFGEQISKDQADSSFLEAVELLAAYDTEWGGTSAAPEVIKRTPGVPLEWVDTGGVLKLDLERAFGAQQLFDPGDYETAED